MTIRSDSFSSVADVAAITRHLLQGEPSFSTTTRPSLLEVESIIDQTSGMINIALTKHGFTNASIAANSTAKLSCDIWVRMKAAQICEITHPIQGVGENESRSGIFSAVMKDADDYVKYNALGWKRLGVTPAYRLSSGLAFTGSTVQGDRVDPDDDTLEQPLFTRRQFDVDTSEDNNGVL